LVKLLAFCNFSTSWSRKLLLSRPLDVSSEAERRRANLFERLDVEGDEE
jgi:hypothetical protein